MWFLQIVLAVYVLLGIRGLVAWVKYCWKDPDFALNPTSIIGSWVNWAMDRYGFDYDDSDFPELEGWLVVLPFMTPLNEAFKIVFDVWEYFHPQSEVVRGDDLDWSRIEDTDDVPQ